jgi:uncharacterized protein YbcC (UPF0753/DUF2309 family)
MGRIGTLRSNWKKEYHIDIDLAVQPILFRILCSYLDQGIATWHFPVWRKGFLTSIREMERNTFNDFFKTKRAKNLLLERHCEIIDLLNILVGDESLYEDYLFDQQFSHQGWSGMVATIDAQPTTLLDSRRIDLHDLIIFELLLEIDALDNKYGENWKPLAQKLKKRPVKLFSKVEITELHEVLAIWQEAFEWTYYDQVLGGISTMRGGDDPIQTKSFQALLCIDDRECSFRRYLELFDKNCETYGTPGFFGVEFFFQPEGGKFTTKLCPAPVTPKYLIKELESKTVRKKDIHFNRHSHSLLTGWLVSQTIGFWSAFELFLNIFRPSVSPVTTLSSKHMDKFSKLTIENKDPNEVENGLQVGFTVIEMTDRIEALLCSIGLVQNFAPIVYIIGHGASSVNNTHYAGYDCGACCGRPGSVNARVAAAMANNVQVRANLRQRGISIPDSTWFVGGLHDTTRDEIEFYDEDLLSAELVTFHQQHQAIFTKALDYNAKERSRRFESIDTRKTAKKIHEEILIRSVSLFEPRPELNHATNALCIVGKRSLSRGLFLDRRSFMNSYNHTVDPDGKYLFNILKAVAPVCGGINLEYYFSRVDNHKLGAGTKLPHNVMGLIGVANGTDGDLRPGLPSQMIEVHDPIRLLVIVEHYPEIVLQTIQKHAETYEWFLNEWIHLVAVQPDTKELWLFKNGSFGLYKPFNYHFEQVADITKLVESHQDNFPVYLIK